MITLRNIQKTYSSGETSVHALRGVSLDIQAGEFIAIMGPSGSGKSTLMHVLGLLDVPDSGDFVLDGEHISELSDDSLAVLRNQKIGFIFQMFNLLSRTSASKNVALPLIYSPNADSENNEKILERLRQVNLEQRAQHKPNQLSGGEQQRVAIARALINDPKIIMADEPTGNLDSYTQTEIMKLLKNLNERGLTIILVTHEEEVAEYAKRQIRMKDGQIVSDSGSSASLTPPSPLRRESKSEGKSSSSILKEIGIFVQQAITAILANKVRSALSMLGILIGVGSVIAMLALGEGTKASMTADLERLGSNLIVVRANNAILRGVAMAEGAAARLTLNDVKDIQGIPGIKKVNPTVQAGVQLVYQNKNWNSEVEGVSPEYASMRAAEPVQGRFFTDRENMTRAKVVVIGQTVREKLFGNEDPINKLIRINRIAFRVIGVLPEKGGSQWRDRDDVVAIPIMTAMKRLIGTDYLRTIEVEVESRERIQQVKDAIIPMLIKSHRLPETRKDSFTIRDMTEIQESIAKVTTTMTIFLGSIAGIALLVGGIGIMNIMLVSVTERTKEIGLRKAIGAKRKDIYLQFLVESMVVSLIGGTSGIIIGSAAAYGLAHAFNWAVQVSLNAILLSVGFSSAVGIIFGIWPAQKAAKLDPIEALRYE